MQNIKIVYSIQPKNHVESAWGNQLTEVNFELLVFQQNFKATKKNGQHDTI